MERDNRSVSWYACFCAHSILWKAKASWENMVHFQKDWYEVLLQLPGLMK